ncbi:hypothetical protein [Mammaliicoccus sciuri]|uniref:hypothetical protein n=1 Tax=Mammaliicoccus sciuri TaxID=1296 RepID=UPI001FB1BBBA|nr:hypothetical protein [Mammaliicoccus sciuri]MCJ0918692.1 hypothetical protein [Mammaliicoccus sciuri]MCJ0961288.1 hypothetical protein [Mammaliicoccus sciuri]
MKLYLITLTISLIALYTFIKRLYKNAGVQDEVEYDPDGIYRHYHIKKGPIPPIDYESDKYKEAETWFSGVGRH